MAAAYARVDAEEAFDWLLAQSVEAQRRSVSMVVSRLVDMSPEAALAQIERIDDHSRPALYRSAFSAWSRYDPDAANAFLGQIPTSERDPAINGMLQQTLFAGNVRSAERLFDRIVDEETRRQAATTMYMHLSRTDPDRAERYRELSSMTIAEDGSITISLPAQGF
ncbi:MAG: hypothetical protein F4089_11370 [Gammaproteobacteria bacterium]|nr:hypothetical protein [Gammaproteobacteria bacterium]